MFLVSADLAILLSFLTLDLTLLRSVSGTKCDPQESLDRGLEGGRTSVAGRTSPITLMPERLIVYPGQTLKLNLRGAVPFRGFSVEARSVVSGEGLGTFTATGDEITVINSCLGRKVASNSTYDLKHHVELRWNVPAGFWGQVVFLYSVSVDSVNVWSSLKSDRVSVKNSDPSINAKMATTQAKAMLTKDNANEMSSTTVPRNHKVFDGCGEGKKACFALPNDCLFGDGNGCRIVATWRHVDNDRWLFELAGVFDDNYLALGLSFDSDMGDDLTTSCLYNYIYERIEIRSGINIGYNNRVLKPPNLGLAETNASADDGILHCQFTRPGFVSIPKGANADSIDFNFTSDEYYILLAQGPFRFQNQAKHTYKDISDKAWSLTTVGNIEVHSKVLIKMHGSLMVIAWIACASSGLFMARYYKKTFTSKILHKDQWFFWHRLLMMITWGVTLTSFGIIFYEMDGLQHIRIDQDSHALLGCFTTAFAFLQPFAAAFRPAPTSKYRPAFNSFHFHLGTAAFYLALTALFFSVDLDKAGLPRETKYLLVAFMVIHVVVHGLLSLQMYSEMPLPERKKMPRHIVNQYQRYSRSTSTMKPKQAKTSKPFIERYSGNKLRKGCLVLYVSVNVFVTVIMLFLIITAPARDMLVNAGLLGPES